MSTPTKPWEEEQKEEIEEVLLRYVPSAKGRLMMKGFISSLVKEVYKRGREEEINKMKAIAKTSRSEKDVGEAVLNYLNYLASLTPEKGEEFAEEDGYCSNCKADLK